MLLKSLRKIILASASPRRSELLGRFIKEFSIEPSHADETIADGMSPLEVALFLSDKKASESAKNNKDGAFIIASDTIVTLNGKIYEKPITPEKAKLCLTELRGKTHTVITGVCLLDTLKEDKTLFAEETSVTFADFTDEIMEKYIACGEGLDRAGGYAIQGVGAILVDKIMGDYDTVMGLPARKLILELLNKKIVRFV